MNRRIGVWLVQLRMVFRQRFPGARFERVWKEMDKNGDGSLSFQDLADHFGMSYLVRESNSTERLNLSPQCDDPRSKVRAART